MKYLVIIFLFLEIGCNQNKNPRVLITTNLGTAEAELYPDKAPKSVAAFLGYVDAGLYKKSSFYRVILDEGLNSAKDNIGIIQGGIWQSNNAKALTLPFIPHESPRETGLSHTTGTLSFARTTPGTARSEFFIVIGDQPGYDSSKSYNPDGQGFAAFGRIIKGMKVIRDIQTQPANGENFIKPIEILNIERE